MFVVCGFGGDQEGVLKSVESRFADGSVQIIGRSYPSDEHKRKDYVWNLTQDVIKRIFGEKGAANFCRPRTDACGLDDKDVGHRSRCADFGEQLACVRRRPRMLVYVVSPRVEEEVFRLLGSAVLIIRMGSDATPEPAELFDTLTSKMPVIENVRAVVDDLPAKHCARLPLNNYQSLAPAPLARDVQNNPENIAAILDRWEGALWNGKFRNAVRRYMRGAYMLPKNVGFQKDMLHDMAILGEDSRKHGFHLISAHHLYGSALRPGIHFDVSHDSKPKAVGWAFTDVVTGRRSSRSERHLNITPSDRLIGEGAPE